MVTIARIKFEKNIDGKEVISVLEEIEKYFGIKTLSDGEFEIHNFK